MRVFSGSLATETNTFAPMPTGLASFRDRGYYPAGQHPDALSFFAGPLCAARLRGKEKGWTLLEGMVAGAQPSGTTTRAAYEALRDELLADLRRALPVDMVLLGLHGAMVADGYDDCEGDVLRRVRAIVGPGVVVGAELDPHCHLTQDMVTHADLLICFKEYPHTDVLERGLELVDLCAAMVAKKIKPVHALVDTGMIVTMHTSREPARGFVDRIQALEGKNGVLSISVAHGFPWGDVPEMGTKLLVYTNGDQRRADALARELADELIGLRDALAVPYPGIDAALDEALAFRGGPVVMADGADNPGGGAAGDSTFVLRRMVERRITDAALGPLWDPVAVRIAFEAGVGARLRLRIGGKIGPLSGDPLDLDCTVKALQHDLVMTGLAGAPVAMGDCALVACAGIEIALISLRNQAMGTDFFTQLGCELTAKRLIVVKSSQHFYASFSKVAKHVIYVGAPGSVTLDITTLPYTKVQRPKWPLDKAVADPTLPRYPPMKRPLACLLMLAAAVAATAQTKTLKVVAHADVKILDPTFTTAYISRNFGYMVYDTLFAQDASGAPKPQMVDKWSTSKDGKQWSFTLRPGLKFSDGSAVTSADAVASLQRWQSRDSLGKALVGAGAEWKAADARSFTLTLNEPFGMVLDALAKPSGFPPVILPERLAKQPTTAPLTEVLGSGPYVFKRDEWVPGNKAVFLRNPNYVPRSEPPSGLAGSKKSVFDRVEWLYLPDSNSAVAALKRGEVDIIEQVPPDYITPLRADTTIKIRSGGAYQGFLVMNQLFPPFNNAKARQALMHAVSQDRFTAAMGLPLDMRVTYCATWFICGGPNETAAGAEPFRKPDIAKAKQLLAEAGYKGEKVVLLVPSDITYLNAEALMTAQAMRSIGMNVDAQTMDWASIGARRAKKDAPEAGGWNIYVTVAGEFDVNSPIANAYLGAPCGTSLPGWPCDKPLDELRTAWVKETVPAKRRQLLDAFHKRAFEAVPYVNAGQYSSALAARASLKNLDRLWPGIPNFWVLDR